MVREEEITRDLEKVAVSFFYRYSRFEFALKESGYLKYSDPGVRAEPDWRNFTRKRCGEYRASDEARELIYAAPKRQVVATGERLEWKDVDLSRCPGDLGKVVRLVQTVRNNLFHGGKHGADGWDDPARTARLLKLGIVVLDQIAEQTSLDGDYLGYY